MVPGTQVTEAQQAAAIKISPLLFPKYALIHVRFYTNRGTSSYSRTLCIAIEAM